MYLEVLSFQIEEIEKGCPSEIFRRFQPITKRQIKLFKSKLKTAVAVH